MSRGNEIRPASAVNVIGQLSGLITQVGPDLDGGG